MGEVKPSRLAGWMPSLTDVAFLMPAVFLFVRLGGAGFLLGDGDTGYHIRAGDWMLAHGRVLDHDVFSYTKAGQPWFAWEWLWDVSFAWLHRHWGMAAVVLASLLLISVTMALLYRLARRQSGSALAAIGFTFVAVAGSSIHWLARPHLFSWLFAVLFLGALERAREGSWRRLWLLPALTVVWTNLHGGFFVGMVLILAYALGEALAWLVESEAEARQAAARRGKLFLAAGAGCLAASLVNPYGWRLHAHIVGYFGNSYAFQNVQEFLSLDFHHPVGPYFEVMLGLGAMTAAWSLYRRRFAHALVVVGWMHLALLSARNVPLFLILAAPPAAWAAAEWLERLRGARVAQWIQNASRAFEDFARGISAVDRLSRVPVISVAAAVALVPLLSALGGASKLNVEYDPQRYPAGALKALEPAECAGRVFANDEWGDYLIYRLYPRTKVFMDGRSDFYGPELSRQYLDVMNGKHGWERTLEAYGVRTVLLPVDASLASTLKESARWRVIHDDGVAIAFRRAGPDGQWARAGCAERERVSAAAGSGVIGDRLIAQPHHRDRKVTKLQLNPRREPS